MNRFGIAVALFACATLGLVPVAAADDVEMAPIGERPTLLGGPGSPEAWLKGHGIGLDVSWIEYGQALVSPDDGDNGMEWGGKLNAKFALDGEKLGLWRGFSVNGLFEYNTGNDDSVNGYDGTLMPVNTQMYHPAGEHTALSVTITQRFNESVSLTLGKFNMVDAAAATPIAGGGGVNTFWNLAFAAPPSGLVPAYITGFSLTVKTEPANYTLMVYDPNDTQDVSGLQDWGEDGINTRLSVQFPVTIGGLAGYQNLVGVYSTRDSVDWNDLPELVLPPSPGTQIEFKDDSWYLGYNFQQYLWQDATNQSRGWGVFGQAFIADGNPNLYRWFVNLGVAGSSPATSRPLDRFGIGAFYLSPSQDLTDSIDEVFGLDVGSESGIEAFYNAALTPWLRLALDLQYISPGVKDYDNGFFAGLSVQVKF